MLIRDSLELAGIEASGRQTLVSGYSLVTPRTQGAPSGPGSLSSHAGSALQSSGENTDQGRVQRSHCLTTAQIACLLGEPTATPEGLEDPSKHERFYKATPLDLPLKSLFERKFICLANLTHAPSEPSAPEFPADFLGVRCCL